MNSMRHQLEAPLHLDLFQAHMQERGGGRERESLETRILSTKKEAMLS